MCTILLRVRLAKWCDIKVNGCCIITYCSNESPMNIRRLMKWWSAQLTAVINGRQLKLSQGWRFVRSLTADLLLFRIKSSLVKRTNKCTWTVQRRDQSTAGMWWKWTTLNNCKGSSAPWGFELHLKDYSWLSHSLLIKLFVESLIDKSSQSWPLFIINKHLLSNVKLGLCLRLNSFPGCSDKTRLAGSFLITLINLCGEILFIHLPYC